MRAGPAVKYAGHRPLFMLPTPRVAKAISGVGHLAQCAKCPQSGSFRYLEISFFSFFPISFLSTFFVACFMGC